MTSVGIILTLIRLLKSLNTGSVFSFDLFRTKIDDNKYETIKSVDTVVAVSNELRNVCTRKVIHWKKLKEKFEEILGFGDGIFLHGSSVSTY